MGGKHKQRMKNNARPSSSGRSAEFLASTSHSPQFTKEIRFVPPTLSLLKTVEFDTSVSPVFQVIFKKMNKKDCITKLKALQEFCDLVSQSDLEDIKGVLRFWATLYAILATDPDHRVREAAHNAHYQVVVKDRKVIAPFLKQVIGPWFTSQYDNYPPAATAATKAFTTTFPHYKVQDCVVFCQKEILTYIDDNLSLNPKQVTEEEAEAKYERIIVATLQGYCLYLNTLTEEQIAKSTQLNIKIIKNPGFFKLATHKTSIIRAGFFKTLTFLYGKAKFLFDDNHTQVITCVFNNLDENEPSVVGFVWETALLIMNLVENWWKSVNLENTYFTKLRKILREGGQGSATVIYPNLLTLLDKLPEPSRSGHFYDNFLENLRLGFKRKTVRGSKSETTAIISATIECLQYIIVVNENNTNLCEKLVKTHLVELVETGFNPDQICFKIIFQKVANLLQYWTKSKNTKCLDFFWNCMKNTPKKQQFSERYVLFVQCLKVVKAWKEMNVSFSNDKPTNKKPEVHLQIDAAYMRNLQDFVYTILKFYVDEIENSDLLPHLNSIIKMFECRDFFVGLNQLIGDGDTSLLTIHTKLCVWLKNEDYSKEILMDLAFTLFKYLSDEEKITMLMSLLEFEGNILVFALKNVFSHPFLHDKVIQTWLRTPKVCDFIMDVVDANLKNNCPSELKQLFKKVFTECENDGLHLDETTIEKIICKIQSPLMNPQEFDDSLDYCIQLSVHVAQAIYTENCSKFGFELLLSLIQFSCRDSSDLDNLTVDTRWEIVTTSQDILTNLSKTLSKETFMTLMENIGNLFEELVNFDHFSNISEVGLALIQSVHNGQPIMVCDVFSVVFERIFLSKLKTQLVGLCQKGEFIKGNISSYFTEQVAEATDDEILNYFIWSFIKAKILASNLEDEANTLVIEVMEFNQILAELLYNLVLFHVFKSNYTMTKYFNKIDKYSNLLNMELNTIINKLQNYNQMEMVLAEKLNCTCDWLWVKVVQVYHQDFCSKSSQDIYTTYLNRVTNRTSQKSLSQIFAKELSFDCVSHGLNTCEKVIILRNLCGCDEIDVQIAEVFNEIKKLRSKDISRFLYETRDLTWEETQTIIEIIRLFTALIKEKFEVLTRQYWDFAVLSLSAWISSCLKFRSNFKALQFQALLISVSACFTTFSRTIAQVKKDSPRHSYVEEWQDLFVPNIQAELLQLWMFLSEQIENLSLVNYVCYQEFGKVIDSFNYTLIMGTNWSRVLKRSIKLVENSSPILQIWGYKMIVVLIPGLIQLDLETNQSEVPNKAGFTCEYFKEILEKTHTILDGTLASFKLGEACCEVAPFTDSYTYTLASLLVWLVLLKMCELSPFELRYQYADWLKTYLKPLLTNLFKLMPFEIYNEAKVKIFIGLFTQMPDVTFDQPLTSNHLEHIVCSTYTFCLSQLPALVRQWWSETDAKIGQIIEKVTTLYVSPLLCNQELHDVVGHENNFKNMTVRTVPSVREVIAVYTVDEAHMELVITLPTNYPLGGLDVRCNRQIGGSLHKQWLMQLKKYLLQQNGRVWDGLSLWNTSLDKKFDGVEECYICFAVFHPGTYQLPKLTCQICKKKFHSACLYKWFSTSNKSSCPICRNLF